MPYSKSLSLLAGSLFLACSLFTSEAALLIHYSFDGEAPGSLSTGEVIANLGSSDTAPSGAAGPAVAAQNLNVDTVADDYLTMSVVLDLSADDVEYQVEITDDLAVWESGSGHVEHVSSTNNGDGTLTVVYRSADPIVAGIQEYFRLRVISRL